MFFVSFSSISPFFRCMFQKSYKKLLFPCKCQPCNSCNPVYMFLIFSYCFMGGLQDALRHVFASRLVDIKDSPTWNRLSFVSCACNGLVLMDESLQLLPAVETLDLSRNHFAKVDNLWKCSKLSHLDLGFNHLRTVASLSEVRSFMQQIFFWNNHG